MAKNRTQFLCNNCGSVHPKWFGKCPDCGTWDALEEYKAPTPDARKAVSGQTADLVHGAEALTLDQINAAAAEMEPRLLLRASIDRTVWRSPVMAESILGTQTIIAFA